MNLLQVGCLGNVGPVFVVPNTTSTGQTFIIVQGSFVNSTMVLQVKDPLYARNLAALGPFGYTPEQCTLGGYADNQYLSRPDQTFSIPPTGLTNFTAYRNTGQDWVMYSNSNPLVPIATSNPPANVTPPPANSTPPPASTTLPTNTGTGTTTTTGNGTTTPVTTTTNNAPATSKFNPVIVLAALVVVLIILVLQKK